MESLLVKDFMNHHPVKVSVKMTVAEAVEVLLMKKQTGGPVIDEQGKVVGFLSEQDCIRKMIESSYYREQVSLVHEIMITEVMSVKPYTSVLEVAQMMIVATPKVYPVIDDDGLLQGVINRTEVLKAIDDHLRAGYRSQ